MTSPDPPGRIVVRNEFAVMEVGFVRRGETVSLTLSDPASGCSVVLDATELEALAHAPRESLRRLLSDAAGDLVEGPRPESRPLDTASDELGTG